MGIKHSTVATFPDEAGAEVNKTEWNDDHVIDDGTLSIAKTTGLQSAIDGKQATITDGDLTIARTTGLQTAIDAKETVVNVALKSPIASPTFTGDVTTASAKFVNAGIAGLGALSIQNQADDAISQVIVRPTGTGNRAQITTANSSDPSTNAELLTIGSDIYGTNENAIRTYSTGTGTTRPLAVYFDTTKIMQITDATGMDMNGNNLDNIKNIIHDTSTTGVALDFAEDQLQLISIAAATTFTTSNRLIGKSKTIKITTDGTERAFTFPAWRFVGAKPETQAASKIGILTITCFGSADTDIVAAYAVEA